jgi:hypothetical protein
MSTHQFDWSNEDDLAVREQMATALYFNEGGDVVVRQRDFYEEDGIIVLTRDSARNLALALLRLVDAEESVPTALASPKGVSGPIRAMAPPKDPTAATRQRRHRDKHRDSHAETVTAERGATSPGLDLTPVRDAA